MKKRIFSIALLCLLAILTGTVSAQELKCDVRVNAAQVSGTDKTVFQNLQNALYEFINNTKWTNINFKTNEKIECSILINIKDRTDADSYSGEINMVMRRPVYKTTYNSPLLNYIDTKFTFNYTDGEPLDFNPNSYMSDLTSTIGFYVYLFLGIDFDTFSLYGGDNFFKVTETVVNSAQGSSEVGWKAFDGNKYRYWLMENMTNQTYRPLRQFMYEYHRLGLDVMAEKPDEGRANIAKALQYLQNVYDSHPSVLFLQLIVESKRDEIINIFSQGNQQEKVKVVNIMKTIDPSKATQYDAILQGGK